MIMKNSTKMQKATAIFCTLLLAVFFLLCSSSPTLAGLIWMMSGGPLWIAFSLWAIGYALVNFKKLKWRGWMPLALLLSTLVLLWGMIPFTSWLNYHMLKPSRMQVIEWVRENPSSLDGDQKLPDKLKRTSRGGTIDVIRQKPLKIFFWTDLGLADNYRGLLYVEDDSGVSKEEMSTRDLYCSRLEENWYDVGCG